MLRWIRNLDNHKENGKFRETMNNEIMTRIKRDLIIIFIQDCRKMWLKRFNCKVEKKEQ